MAGPRKRPADDAVLEKLPAYADAWIDIAGCTEPADRPRAEAALRDLYRRAGEAETPDIVWVPSPGCGLAAYVLARMSRRAIPNPYAASSPFLGSVLERSPAGGPFALEPAWALRLARRALVLLPESVASRVANVDSTDAATLGWSIGRTTGVGDDGAALRLLQLEVAESHRRYAQREAVAEPPDEAQAVDPVDLDSAAAAVLGPAWEHIVSALGPLLARELYRHATAEVAANLLRNVRIAGEAAQAMQPGQFDGLTPVLAIVREVGGRPLWRTRAQRDAHDALVDGRIELARSAGPWWALQGLAIVSERPARIRRDDRARLHAASGPAIEYRDGTRTWAWHGVRVPQSVIDDPETITIEAIDGERNAEVRRVLIERYGEQRFIRDAGALLVSEDETGRLWRRRSGVGASRWRWVEPDEPVVMVEVLNATPEPDGTRKTYFLRVPPTVQTAQEAVAWTFGMAGDAYRPSAEA